MARADVRSILATNGYAPHPTPAGAAFTSAVVLTLPSVPTRSLADYALQPAIEGIEGGEVS